MLFSVFRDLISDKEDLNADLRSMRNEKTTPLPKERSAPKGAQRDSCSLHLKEQPGLVRRWLNLGHKGIASVTKEASALAEVCRRNPNPLRPVQLIHPVMW